MTEIRPSRPEELPAQKALWKTAFGDEDRYIDWFYTCCGTEHMLLLLEDGRLASMLALLPHGLTLPGGGTARGYYVYALATDPAVRSKGYGRQLLRAAGEHAAKLGGDCVTVVPAEASLFKFFGTVGFDAAFFHREVELLHDQAVPARPGDRVEPISPAEYNALRARLLEGAPAVTYGEELIRYQEGMSRLASGGLYRVEAGGVEGCAAVEYRDAESVLFKELLISPEQMSGALAVFAGVLPGRRCFVRTPACWAGMKGSYIQPFGMIRWLNGALARQWREESLGYMGLGFD